MKPTFWNKANLVAICITASLLPFLYSSYWASYASWFWALTWLAEGGFRTKFKDLFSKSSLLFWAYTLFLVLHVIGCLYSENQKEAWFDVQVKVNLFVYPFMLFFANEYTKQKMGLVLKVFTFSVILSSFICIILAFYNSISHVDGNWVFNPVVCCDLSWKNSILWDANYFSHNYFSFFTHPSYFSMFICLAIAFIFNDLLNPQTTYKKLKFSAIVLLSITILLVSARIGQIIGILILGYFSMVWIHRKGLVFRYIYYTFSIGLILSLGYMFSQRFVTLFDLANQKEEQNLITENNKLRFIMWREGLHIAMKNKWVGVGTGDVKDVVSQHLKKINLVFASEKKINVHNQYLETFVGLGLFALLNLLFIFFIAMVLGVQQKSKLLIILIISILFFFITESMLNRLNGVLFFSLLLPVTYLYVRNLKVGSKQF